MRNDRRPSRTAQRDMASHAVQRDETWLGGRPGEDIIGVIIGIVGVVALGTISVFAAWNAVTSDNWIVLVWGLLIAFGCATGAVIYLRFLAQGSRWFIRKRLTSAALPDGGAQRVDKFDDGTCPPRAVPTK